jgi:hypothetical protein
MMFTPFNFHDSDPTRRSAQGVKVDNGDKETRLDIMVDGTKRE